jgi:hypothetical protein
MSDEELKAELERLQATAKRTAAPEQKLVGYAVTWATNECRQT